MGDMAEYMINGDDCQICGMPFADEGEGFPRTCDSCLEETEDLEESEE